MDKFEIAKQLFIDGLALLQDGNYEAAETRFRKSLELIPDRASTLTNLTAAQIKLEKYAEAEVSARKAIAIDGANSEAWLNLGLIEVETNHAEQALECLDKAIQLKPEYAEAWYNKGLVLGNLQRHDEALACYGQAVQLKPDYAEAWLNRGVTLKDLKRHEEALTHYDQAIRLKPDYFESYWNKSLVELVQGKFEDGWTDYEYRWKRTKHDPCLHADIPGLKSLDDLKGSKILVWAEQGLGDTIQFSRYLEPLVKLGAETIFEVQRPLKNLLSNQFSCRVVSQGESFGRVDFQIPLLSLPRLFNTNLNSIPSKVPYLKVSGGLIEHWRRKLDLSKGKLNIGIACSGNPCHVNDMNRSMKLEAFEPVLELANLFLVQKELREADADFLNQHPQVKFLGDEISDFEDTGAIVGNLDLIVSVDTSLVHMAGALGKPVYVLLPWSPEWRWMLDRDDSPWYPTARLIRQPAMGDWKSAVGKLVKELRERPDLASTNS
jgi:tetratricopeptide (TPR) repeat protein